jgi:hypothetical protein
LNCKPLILHAEYVGDDCRDELLTELSAVLKDFRDVFQGNRLCLKKICVIELRLLSRKSSYHNISLSSRWAHLLWEIYKNPDSEKSEGKAFSIFLRYVPPITGKS